MDTSFKKEPYASSLYFPESRSALRPRYCEACTCSLLENIPLKLCTCSKDVEDQFPANSLLTVSQNGAAVVPQNCATVVPAKRSLMGEKNHTFQTSVWLSPEDIAWIDARLQEIKRMGGWRGVARSACIRSLIRAAMQRTPLHMEGVTREEELTERLSANYSFLKER